MDTSLEWKIVIGKKRFTSGHHTVREEEDCKNYGRSDGLHEKQKHDIAWRLGMDRWLLA